MQNQHLKRARQSEVGTVNHVDRATCGEQPGEDLGFEGLQLCKLVQVDWMRSWIWCWFIVFLLGGRHDKAEPVVK
jgi:hypothetical protein